MFSEPIDDTQPEGPYLRPKDILLLMRAAWVYPTPGVILLMQAVIEAISSLIPDGDGPLNQQCLELLCDLKNALPSPRHFDRWKELTGEPAPRNLAELERQAKLAGVPLPPRWVPSRVLSSMQGALQRRHEQQVE